MDYFGNAPNCCPVCKTGDHPMQSHSPSLFLSRGSFLSFKEERVPDFHPDVKETETPGRFTLIPIYVL
ncbi:MAG TPA: hypothetical protein PLP33_30040 [Leptospiraceae bacterium]|nr:hypothetical protein [Leptospiraceae bacterium]